MRLPTHWEFRREKLEQEKRLFDHRLDATKKLLKNISHKSLTEEEQKVHLRKLEEELTEHEVHSDGVLVRKHVNLIEDQRKQSRFGVVSVKFDVGSLQWVSKERIGDRNLAQRLRATSKSATCTAGLGCKACVAVSLSYKGASSLQKIVRFSPHFFLDNAPRESESVNLVNLHAANAIRQSVIVQDVSDNCKNDSSKKGNSFFRRQQSVVLKSPSNQRAGAMGEDEDASFSFEEGDDLSQTICLAVKNTKY